MRTLSWAVVAALLAGCGASSKVANPADMATTAPDLGVPNTVGAAGGSVSLPDGTRVDIPAGALSTDTTITITPTVVAPPRGVGPAYVFGPEGTTFAMPVKVTLPFDPTKLPMGSTAANVVVMTSPIANPSFASLGGTVADSTHVT